MTEKKKLLIGRLKQKLKEIIRKEMEEGSGTAGVAGVQSPYAFAKSGKGNERAATASTDYELVKKKKKDDAKKTTVKPKVVPVGSEKTPDVVKDPKKPGITKADAAVLARRQNVASSLGHKDDATHYARLLALANKELKK
jgi:hypothetical protein